MTNNRPTIRDVARQAGVSHQTVSRVINASESVSPETRARVEAAIAELGFKANAIARSMAQGRSNTLACISPNLTDFTFASIIEGAEQEARRFGCFMLSSSAGDPEAFRDLLAELIDHRRVDGLIIINPYADSRHEYIPDDFPLVFVGAHARDKTFCSVSLDDDKVAYEATRHLLSQGHKEVAMLTGPLQEDCSRDRSSGYARALEEAGIPLDKSLILEGDWSASSGQEALLKWKKMGKLPHAVFAQNDRMALGILRAARDLGMNVPGEIAVIGVDDMPLASYFDPPLSTMKQDMPRIGLEAVRMLMHKINNEPVKRRQIKLSAELVVRQSTLPSTKGGG